MARWCANAPVYWHCELLSVRLCPGSTYVQWGKARCRPETSKVVAAETCGSGHSQGSCSQRWLAAYTMAARAAMGVVHH